MSESDLTKELNELKEKYNLLLEENEKIVAVHRKELMEHRKDSTLLRELGGFTKIGAWELDTKTREVYWTDEVKIIHDVEKLCTNTRGIPSILHPGFSCKLQAALDNSEKTERFLILKWKLLAPKGITKQVRTIGRIDNEVGIIYGTFQDITELKLIHDTQLFLINSNYLGDRETFFKSLARFLSKNLNMEFVCIDRLTGGNLSAETLAMYYQGKFDDNIEYTLKETPCGQVVGKNICYFPKNVRSLFPYDQALQDMNAESYVGTTLWSSEGNPIGLIAVIGKNL
ncbi:MAG: hypothetical protein IPJ75_06270 [Ignavibacteriales bacterium]|nr:hypothetical protein [Ignavibacteriales bacterium]